MPTQIGRWQWYDYPSVGSTNDVAKEQSRFSSDTPKVFTAETQTAGRGRRGRSWVSVKGNLFMSQLLTTGLPISDMVFIASLSVAETLFLLTEGVRINIKWPNDVLINGKKICGILIEAAENDNIVIGTGINLSSAPDDSEVIYPTTSLSSLGFNISREIVLREYLKIFDANINLGHQKGFSVIRAKWLQYAYKLDEYIKIMQKNRTIEGIFKGIDEQGLLLLQQGSSIIKVAVGDVFS